MMCSKGEEEDDDDSCPRSLMVPSFIYLFKMTQIRSFPSVQAFQHQPAWRMWLLEEGLAGQQ